MTPRSTYLFCNDGKTKGRHELVKWEGLEVPAFHVETSKIGKPYVTFSDKRIHHGTGSTRPSKVLESPVEQITGLFERSPERHPGFYYGDIRGKGLLLCQKEGNSLHCWYFPEINNKFQRWEIFDLWVTRKLQGMHKLDVMAGVKS